MLTIRISLCVVVALLAASSLAFAQDSYSLSDLSAAFEGAQPIDLATSKVSSVVTLRTAVGIPAPRDTVLVKTFRRETLPPVLAPAFARKGITGVTIAGRYIAVVQTAFDKEYQDVLRHELVHAYITLASPKPLPFWFQEGSAVYFSTDSARRVYGIPSKDVVGTTEIRAVELTPEYKQKLQSFHYLIETAGKEKFYRWYRRAVETGNVNPRALLGLDRRAAGHDATTRRSFPAIWIAVAAAAVAVVIVIGVIAARREREDW